MIRIITDSAADFEPAELEKNEIHCIPLTVTFGGDEYQENVDLNKDQFYDLLLNSGKPAKTSQASPRILMDLFKNAHKAGDEAIYITLSSALSGTYQSAVMVQNDLGYEECHVLDSRNATGGQRILVEHAVLLRDQGKTAAEILHSLEALRERIVLYACIDTLEYLYRGGRISHTVYKLGSLTNIKPIISVDPEGRVAIPAKAMGMRRGMDLLSKRPQARQPDGTFPFYVMYTDQRSAAEALAAQFRAVGIRVPEEHIIRVGAAIGSHIGPNACGMVYVGM